jgi:hypothetical protein
MTEEALMIRPEGTLTIEQVKAQVVVIQEVMKEVMEEGQHWGTIPGCGKKPALFKPGAEKLSMMFRLNPSFDINKTEFDGGHREYEINCVITHMDTGKVVGAGVGSCSTMETKYRYPPRS